ncbi:cell envelope biogenesis protein OmpA [Wolbachia endosymbiont of Spodoptera picta]|uniref:cell envelope biogenesis protein OmpA n=1 Tax=Wolbachia endosymbiont of Spodoptera picta TaxID=2769078 RepID=UPI001BA8F9BF|nr:cell envelope biogenesis protein OmpA [Wolbachia endosymbiont of Spodoptera picta]QUI59940.1 cell envelope biogenesis protein OmpA [Wolbachia endosymbiont of Spodoptera picta]
MCMNYMRTMKVFAVLVALASTASNGTSELEDQYKDRYEDQYKDQYEDQHKDHCEDQYEDRYEDQYEDHYYVGYVGYVGLNFGTRWGESFKLNPNVVFGYHHNKNSKFELEVLANISDITDKAKRKVGASLLANYLYYPDLEIDPIKLYASIGLGGYIRILPSFGLGEDTNAVNSAATVAAAAGQNETLDKILGAISYKVKLGVDCEIIPQIVSTVAIAASGQLSGFKPPMKKPDAIIEVGIRYNF